MVDVVSWLISQLRSLTSFADPGLIQAILGIYIFYTSVTIFTGTFSLEKFQTITLLVMISIFLSYSFGFVLLDKESNDNR